MDTESGGPWLQPLFLLRHLTVDVYFHKPQVGLPQRRIILLLCVKQSVCNNYHAAAAYFSLTLKQETQFDFSCGDNHLSQTSMGVKGNPHYNKNTDLGLQ